MTIVFVRHSKPEIVVGEPANMWALSAVGRQRAEQLGGRLATVLSDASPSVFSSTEAKAEETAALLGLGTVTVDERFDEVQKPWFDEAEDHAAAVSNYLRGHDQPGFEARTQALARFHAAVADASSGAVIATHGTVLSLYLSQQVSGFDPLSFWLGLEMPDAWQFDRATGEATRI